MNKSKINIPTEDISVLNNEPTSIQSEEINITSVYLKKNGTLRINGKFNPDRLNLYNIDDINFAIKIKDTKIENNNCNITIIKIENGTRLSEYKFTVECNILDLEFKANNEEKSLIIIMKNKDVNIKKEIDILPKRTHIEEICYIHGRRFYCSLHSDNTPLILKMKEKSSEIEVKFIYVYKDFIKLVLDTSDNINKVTVNDKFSVFVKPRGSKIKYFVNYDTNKDENSIIIKTNEILSKIKSELGIYDFGLKKGESIYKLSTLNDRVFTKKDCVKMPAAIGLNKDNEPMSIHPYYTDDNRIAFKLKNGIEITQIDSIKKGIKGINIKGILYNRFINENTSNGINGSIYLNIDDKETELNYTGIINIKNSITGRCEFNIDIPKKEIKDKKISLRKVSSNLKSNPYKYSINCDSIKSICDFKL